MIAEKDVADPVTSEIIRNTLIAITDEMKTNLMRTAYNPIIYEALDYTVGLFDAQGNTISIGLGLPMFIRGLSDAIKAKLAFYGPEGIDPEDILLTNDAYIMGSHLNHMIFTLPVFHEGELVAFASSMAHWQDVGGTLGGQTRDIYSEGLQMPIVKIFKRGVQDRELTDVIKMNVRIPELAMGDFRAQVAAIRTGQRRANALFERYGKAAVEGSVRNIYDQSERLSRLAVKAIPDGVYEAESYMDDDGVGSENVPIKVRVVVAGDEMTIDLSEVSRQVAGYFNSGATAGRSAAQVAFKCVTTPKVFPINDGTFRPLKVILPPGRVVSAVKPAAMRQWMTIPMTVVDTIFKALSPAIPDRVVAGHHADLCSTNVFGTDPRNGRFFIASVGLPGGGWGAKHNTDGMSATVCINDGDTHNSPTEATEVKLPILIERYALRPDSGGAGRHRGGLGVAKHMRALAPLNVVTRMERTQCAPWGLQDGKAGLPNRLHIRKADGSVVQPPNGKLQATTLAPGEMLAMEVGGGGGFGDPKERPRRAVRDDVRRGYVTREAALRDYGLSSEELDRLLEEPTV
ncbi:MAG TPA: hydantoinase B/oxoprolinase family protein [Candidatus Acidoferrales bacterium]|nr:hydantoinase B/oxoprolinase family protein [Candidatus Acidoferrales bacterium]